MTSLALALLLIVGMPALDAAELAEELAVYEFPSGRLSAQPSYPNTKAHFEAMDAKWVVPNKDEPLYGVGGKTGTAYLNNAAAPRQFDPEIYLTFTIKADSGHVFNLRSLSFRFGASTLSDYEGRAFPVFARIASDAQLPAYSHEIPLGAEKVGEAVCNITTVPSAESVFTEVMADLSGEDFQNRENVTFRVYLYCPERSSGIFLRLDDVVIRGSVARK